MTMLVTQMTIQEKVADLERRLANLETLEQKRLAREQRVSDFMAHTTPVTAPYSILTVLRRWRIW